MYSHSFLHSRKKNESICINKLSDYHTEYINNKESEPTNSELEFLLRISRK